MKSQCFWKLVICFVYDQSWIFCPHFVIDQNNRFLVAHTLNNIHLTHPWSRYFCNATMRKQVWTLYFYNRTEKRASSTWFGSGSLKDFLKWWITKISISKTCQFYFSFYSSFFPQTNLSLSVLTLLNFPSGYAEADKQSKELNHAEEDRIWSEFNQHFSLTATYK